MLALPAEYDRSLRVITADRDVLAPERGQPVDLVRKNQDLLPPADACNLCQKSRLKHLPGRIAGTVQDQKMLNMGGVTQELLQPLRMQAVAVQRACRNAQDRAV